MKKILFTIAIVIMLVCGAKAQSDGFFRGGDSGYSGRDGEGSGISGTTPNLVGGGVGLHNTDQPGGAPLGSGLLVLTVLGAGYAVSRREN